MASRPKGVQSFTATGTGVADQAIKSAVGILYAVNLSWSGADVGDVVHIHDGTSTAGTKIFTFRIPTAAGSFAAHFAPVGKEALLGLYLNIQATGANWG